MYESVDELDAVLSGGDEPVRVDEAGDLGISPLTAGDVPDEAKTLKVELTEMLDQGQIANLAVVIAR